MIQHQPGLFIWYSNEVGKRLQTSDSRCIVNDAVITCTTERKVFVWYDLFSGSNRLFDDAFDFQVGGLGQMNYWCKVVVAETTSLQC